MRLGRVGLKKVRLLWAGGIGSGWVGLGEGVNTGWDRASSWAGEARLKATLG